MKPLVCGATILLAVMLMLFITPARGDQHDLSNGVFIAHHPPGIQYTHPPPVEGWCQHYLDNFEIECCEQQNPSVWADTSWVPVVWYVLSAWDEPKQWCGVEFGFAEYDEAIFGFVDWDHCCCGGECLEISTEGWPGPYEGTAFVATGGASWFGNLVPVYWFSGYGYAEGVIPLGPDPHIPFGGWGDCVPPIDEFEATCFGGLGIFTEGVACYPEGGPSPPQATTWGTIKHLYR